jgi:hypothetical protein
MSGSIDVFDIVSGNVLPAIRITREDFDFMPGNPRKSTLKLSMGTFGWHWVLINMVDSCT